MRLWRKIWQTILDHFNNDTFNVVTWFPVAVGAPVVAFATAIGAPIFFLGTSIGEKDLAIVKTQQAECVRHIAEQKEQISTLQTSALNTTVDLKDQRDQIQKQNDTIAGLNATMLTLKATLDTIKTDNAHLLRAVETDLSTPKSFVLTVAAYTELVHGNVMLILSAFVDDRHLRAYYVDRSDTGRDAVAQFKEMDLTVDQPRRITYHGIECKLRVLSIDNRLRQAQFEFMCS